jgi:GTP-binding protein HflX
VGYTNAGKSTLFNALTQAGAWESSQLFATLDPLLRKLRLPNRLEVVLSDTVGFIRKLPHGLVAAFRATLEEVQAADLLLHVVDVSNHGWREQVTAVEDVLLQLGVQNTPTIQVFNKIDLLDSSSPGEGAAADPKRQRPVMVAARLGSGISELVDCIAAMLDSFMVQVQWKIPYLKADLISRLRGSGQVLSETYEEDGIQLQAVMPRSTARFVEDCLADGGVHRRDAGQKAE